jgi:hypothetical protein
MSLSHLGVALALIPFRLLDSQTAYWTARELIWEISERKSTLLVS